MEFTIISTDDEIILEAIKEYNRIYKTDFEVVEFIYDEVVFAKINASKCELSHVFDLGYYFHSYVTLKRQSGKQIGKLPFSITVDGVIVSYDKYGFPDFVTMSPVSIKDYSFVADDLIGNMSSSDFTRATNTLIERFPGKNIIKKGNIHGIIIKMGEH